MRVEYSREELRGAYEKFTEPNFVEDERMPLDKFCDYFVSDRYKDKHFIEIEDNYVLLWCELPDNIVCIEFFVVAEGVRGCGVGTKVFGEWMERMGSPRLMMEIDGENAARFWGRFGVKPVPGYHYVQPSLDETLQPVYNLVLSTNFHQTPDEVEKMVGNWFRIGFGIELNKPA